MLTGTLTVMVNNLFYESFNTTFIGNGKAIKILITFFLFSIKTFFKWIINHYPNDIR